MNKRGGGKAERPKAERPKEEPLPLWVWLDAAPAVWLALVISAYGLLALAAMVPTRRPVPGMPEVDRLALPCMLVTVSAGIIRYFFLRVLERNATRAAAELGRRDIA